MSRTYEVAPQRVRVLLSLSSVDNFANREIEGPTLSLPTRLKCCFHCRHVDNSAVVHRAVVEEQSGRD